MGMSRGGKSFSGIFGGIFGEKEGIIQKIGIFRIMLIIFAGILLVVSSVTDSSKDNKTESAPEDALSESAALDAMAKYTLMEEEKLEKILGHVEGIGSVKVMITLASSEERMTLKDIDNTGNNINERDDSGSARVQEEHGMKSENVIVSSGGTESPYVVQVNSPRIEGVVVVAQGAGKGRKDTEIIDAVMALFSIEAHKIKVMKMEK